jgi:purine-nucleoside phosphorylase
VSAKGRLDRLTDAVRPKMGGMRPRVGIVLGSGFSGFADRLEDATLVPYESLPDFPCSTVLGHPGRFVFGRLPQQGPPVAIMAGRVHLYEGYRPEDVVLPIRCLIALGVDQWIITNAAGAINPSFRVPQAMLITDQLNLTGRSPLEGPNEPTWGARFPDMSGAFDVTFRSTMLQVAAARGLSLAEGVYAGLLGPAYETPAEVRMLGRLGADAVGMSTVLEVIAARHMGARVLGLSLLANWAAGLGSEKTLSHEDVSQGVMSIADPVAGAIEAFVQGIA